MNKSYRKRGGSKTRSIVVLCVLLVLTLVCGILGATGMRFGSRGLWKLLPWLPTTDAANWPESLPLGLDLRGGVYVEYSASQPEDVEGNFSDLMDSTIAVIQNRLTDKGYPEATVQKIDAGTGIRVEVPDVSDPQELLDLIGTPAELSFRGPDGVEFMTGKQVSTAMPASQDGEYVISFTLTAEGARLFAEKTMASVGQQISIYLDGDLLISPTVQTAITEGRGVINGMGSLERAQTIAAQIQSGALPLTLTQQKVDTVSATLGDTALSTSILAGMIGILLVMLLMIVRYRMNGVVASWALCIYIIVLFFLIAVIPGIQLTLPGLAGIVLGIGMAVDANVIIYERFNEEIRAGKAVKAAARAGFRNAMSAILDSNVTTIIAGVVLLIYGTGSVQGFAKTLLLGVVVSMLSAVLVTRLLMNAFIGAGLDKPAYFCNTDKKEGEQA
ncbi:MAG: protein translocase subunit SecD [Clostridia bacterium]|nr:protein translocase subunit SecD [Clostridia bacterium]